MGRYGGFSDRLRVQWTWARPLPDALDLAKTGPLLCGGITVSHRASQRRLEDGKSAIPREGTATEHRRPGGACQLRPRTLEKVPALIADTLLSDLSLSAFRLHLWNLQLNFLTPFSVNDYFRCTSSTPNTSSTIPTKRTGLNGTLSTPNQPNVSAR